MSSDRYRPSVTTQEAMDFMLILYMERKHKEALREERAEIRRKHKEVALKKELNRCELCTRLSSKEGRKCRSCLKLTPREELAFLASGERAELLRKENEAIKQKEARLRKPETSGVVMNEPKSCPHYRGRTPEALAPGWLLREIEKQEDGVEFIGNETY